MMTRRGRVRPHMRWMISDHHFEQSRNFEMSLVLFFGGAQPHLLPENSTRQFLLYFPDFQTSFVYVRAFDTFSHPSLRYFVFTRWAGGGGG